MNGNGAEARGVAILGGGNIGQALARGLVIAEVRRPEEVFITRRKAELLRELQADGYRTSADNVDAVRSADIIVAAVQPGQLVGLLQQIAPELDPARHLLVSVVSDVPLSTIRRYVDGVPVVRAMPNTAIAIRESMTCLAGDDEAALHRVEELFDAVGRTLIIREDLMGSATALGACGIAFALRWIRAASQGGIEIGFHPEEALLLAAQTAKGAAHLLLSGENHPESEIDRVTTPRGCTIAGLNEMEHRGFSSALIKGILVSARKAESLFEE